MTVSLIAGRYAIRPARADDLEALPQIERDAARMFEGLGDELGMATDATAEVDSVEAFRTALDGDRLWVGVDPDDLCVGFAMATLVDGNAHLEELDVHPAHSRKGIGSALVETVCMWAGESSYECVTLSTFRNIAWNAPFYGRRGFVVVPPVDCTPGLRRIVEIERSIGLDTKLRVIMRRSTH